MTSWCDDTGRFVAYHCNEFSVIGCKDIASKQWYGQHLNLIKHSVVESVRGGVGMNEVKPHSEYISRPTITDIDAHRDRRTRLANLAKTNPDVEATTGGWSLLVLPARAGNTSCAWCAGRESQERFPMACCRANSA